MANLVFDISRLLKVKYNHAARLPIQDFLLVCHRTCLHMHSPTVYLTKKNKLEILTDLTLNDFEVNFPKSLKQKSG